MSCDPIRRIADSLLYEGYLLWPYRRSAIKNRKRWTFGGVYPRPYSRLRPDEPWRMATECLIEAEEEARARVSVRFLHVVQRTLRRIGCSEPVDELQVGGERYLAFDEATEREVAAGPLALDDLDRPERIPIEIGAGRSVERLKRSGDEGGSIVRSWRPLRGHLEIRSEPLEEGALRLRVEICNTADWDGTNREEALERTFVATHTILEVEKGAFVSLLDPPPHLRKAAEACRNEHTWPVLVGEEGERGRMLSSPIILYDYPRVAPESPADLFDATEIDELLTLNILALSDEEKLEMRATDPKARELLERASSMTAFDLRRLHGILRAGSGSGSGGEG